MDIRELLRKASEETNYTPFDKQSPTSFRRPKTYSSLEMLAYFTAMVDEGQLELAIGEMTDLLTLGPDFCSMPFPPSSVRGREELKQLCKELNETNPGLLT